MLYETTQLVTGYEHKKKMYHTAIQVNMNITTGHKN